ncbi:MAG: hypothetical protein HQL19_08420 [Candidatus Omnitrophica bacterium]|nr:hypothetical protein [Candidatus Omnitrophota bacterium]
MSIIHDALKKVQSKPAPVSTGEIPQTNDPFAPPAPDKGRDTNRSLTILMACVITVAVIVIFGILFKLVMDSTERTKITARNVALPAAATAQTSSQPPPPAKVLPLPLNFPPLPAITKPPEPNTIKIEGVMDMGGKMVALINGNIYEIGQIFDGKMITNIGFDSVTIKDNGTIRTIPIKR